MDNAQHDNSFLTFRVGPYCLAVPAVDAEAIITMPKIRSVPLVPDSVAGVFSHRGKIAVVISLKRKFGIKKSDDTSDQLIISQLSSGLTAFCVDEVLDIIPASGLNFNTLPGFGILSAFDRFAVKNDSIILGTDFELLCRLEDSKENTDSLKTLTHALKPKTATDRTVPDDNSSISKTDSKTCVKEKEEQKISGNSDSDASLCSGDNSPYTGIEKTLKHKFKTAGNRSVRKAIPYKARTILNPPPVGQILYTDRQTVREKTKRHRWPAVAGILIATIVFIFIIRLWSGSDMNFIVAFRGMDPVVYNTPEVSTQHLNPSQHFLADDNLKILTDTADLPKYKDDESTESGKPADFDRTPQEKEEINLDRLEEDNLDLSKLEESKQVLRIETDDFTLTIERPQAQKTDVVSKLAKQPSLEVEKSQILKTEEQTIVKTEQFQIQKADETKIMSATSERAEIVHLVVKGDTLWDIAAKYLGDPFLYPELAKLSRINDPDLIYPGDLIRIIIKKQPAMEKVEITADDTEITG